MILVLVAVVRIRVMWVRMRQLFVPMVMRVARARGDPFGVVVAMMLVMFVLVRVLDALVRMDVSVALGEVQPHAPCHECRSDREVPSQSLLEDKKTECRTRERRGRKIRPGTRGTELAQRPHEQRQADPVACESE